MFQARVSSVSSVFIFMLQMFYLDVSKVDQSVACRRTPTTTGAPPWFTCRRQRPADASWRAYVGGAGGHRSRFRRVGAGRGSTVQTLDGHGSAVLPCEARDGRGPRFQTLTLVGNGMERVGCDAGTGARELRPDMGLGLDV